MDKSRGLNKVLLIGRVGRDPELRRTANGRPVATFSLAIDQSRHVSEGERHDQTEWFSVVAWDGLAEFCHAQLAPGQAVFVEGRLKNRRWEDAQRKRHAATEVVAAELIVLADRSAALELERTPEAIAEYGVKP